MKFSSHLLVFFVLSASCILAQDQRNSFPSPDTVSTDSVSRLLDLPNVFTPNNDGLNDVLILSGAGLETIKLEIYNRWGTREFIFLGPNDQWDGRNTSGGECPAGVYYYFFSAAGVDGKSYEGKGTVQLLR
jgi:gliding motility-associated-like protein